MHISNMARPFVKLWTGQQAGQGALGHTGWSEAWLAPFLTEKNTSDDAQSVGYSKMQAHRQLTQLSKCLL
jgi:hypothetical protein